MALFPRPPRTALDLYRVREGETAAMIPDQTSWVSDLPVCLQPNPATQDQAHTRPRSLGCPVLDGVFGGGIPGHGIVEVRVHSNWTIPGVD